MRNYNDSSYDTIPRNGILSRFRSQNHYYIQANQFQRRYQNSLMNAYRLKSSRKCPPCCGAQGDRQHQSNMTFCDNEKQNQEQYGYQNDEYYQTSHFIPNSDTQTIDHLQKSKRYLEELVEKSNFNFKIHKERTQNQMETLQKLIETKDYQIQELNKQISRLKKISFQTLPNGVSISQIKQDQTSLIEIQNKVQTIKELQRKLNRLREQNSYFREDIQIKNKEIQQQKSKFKLKQENDTNIKRELEKQNDGLKQERKLLNEKLIWLEKYRQQREAQSMKDKQRMKKLEAELQFTKIRLLQTKSESQNIISRNTQKIKAFENQFMALRQRSKEKDMQIQSLFSKISCIQSELDFFKDKFTNLLFQIERQQRQSATIYEQAVSLKEQGIKFYEVSSRIRQSESIDQESQPRSTRVNENNWFDPIQNRLTESIPVLKGGFGRDTTICSPSNKKFNRFDQYSNMFESEHELIHKFPSLNMGFSPMNFKQ